MKPITKLLIIANLLALFGYLGYSLAAKEQLLREGTRVLLELAPSDPRSLMQGDYMRLDYAIERDLLWEENSKRGYVIVQLDGNGVATAKRIQETLDPLTEGEYAINYLKKDWSVDIGAGSYFFQEGRADDFQAAEYGSLVVDDRGNSLLVGLVDTAFQLIE